MTERRRHPRVIVEGMNIHARTIFNTEAEILDVSATGVSVRCPKRLNIGGMYSFKFRHKKEEISMKGVVIWSKLTGSRQVKGEVIPVYTAGIQFGDASAGKARHLMATVADVIRERRLSGVRVKMVGDEKVVLARSESCWVRDLSAGGMRLEMSAQLPVDSAFGIELLLPGNKTPISCRGRVAFCKTAAEEPAARYAVGVEFIGMAAGTEMRLRSFIDTLVPSLQTTR